MTLESDRIKELETDLEVERQGRILAMRQIMDALGLSTGSTMVTENVVRRINIMRLEMERVIGEREDFRGQVITLTDKLDQLDSIRNAESEIFGAMLEQLAIAGKDAEEAAARALALGNELAGKILLDAAKIMTGVSTDTTKFLLQVRAAFEAPTQQDT